MKRRLPVDVDEGSFQLTASTKEEERGDFSVPKLKKRKKTVSFASETPFVKESETFRKQSPSTVIEWTGVSNKGKKPMMEDKMIEIEDLSQINNDPWFTDQALCSLFGVLDGHGGSEIASFVQRELPMKLCLHLLEFCNGKSVFNEQQSFTQAVQKSLHKCFKLLDRDILDRCNVPGSSSSSSSASSLMSNWEGCTSTVILFIHHLSLGVRLAFTANLGDSKAVLYRVPLSLLKSTMKETSTQIGSVERIRPLQLTVDDTCLQMNEIRRVESMNGRIQDSRINGVLQITRSFGDAQLKKCGVIAIPHISRFQIVEKTKKENDHESGGGRDLFCVICSDGVWSVFTPRDCGLFILEKMQSRSEPSLREVAQQLVAECLVNRQAKDNVSVLILRLGEIPRK